MEMSTMTSTNDTRFAQVVQRVIPGGRLLRRWDLTGGISAGMTALEVERPDGQSQRMIVPPARQRVTGGQPARCRGRIQGARADPNVGGSRAKALSSRPLRRDLYPALPGDRICRRSDGIRPGGWRRLCPPDGGSAGAHPQPGACATGNGVFYLRRTLEFNGRAPRYG